MRNLIAGALGAAGLLVLAAPAWANFQGECKAELAKDPNATPPVQNMLCGCYEAEGAKSGDSEMNDKLLSIIKTPKGPERQAAVQGKPETVPIFQTCIAKLQAAAGGGQ
ncbi:MAG: hypothetical protein H6923_04790 [Alphaproteobacteria bacterium]|nr:hypothetical protein [Alphaproteobacteria bacterium]